MNKFIFFLLLIGTISCVHAACFDNGTFPNSTANPCLVNGGPFYQLPPAAYPPHLSSPYYQQVNPYQQPYGYQTGARVPTPQLPGSNVIFPKTGYQNAYNPYYRPDDISRLGYSYPAGYRGPQTEYYQYGGPQYNNHLSQPPSRYTLGQGHPNFSPVAPLFQRRTYNSMYDPDHRQDHTREPIFMDRGTVAFMGRDAELTCAFYDNRYRIVSVSLRFSAKYLDFHTRIQLTERCLGQSDRPIRSRSAASSFRMPSSRMQLPLSQQVIL